jgi:AcrR family transcriptional regulator
VTEGPPDLDLRHQPVQQRGRERFNAILSASRDLLTEAGLERFTIEDVAARAEIPVGSIYQFFPNKFAIVTELHAQDTAAMVQSLRAIGDRFPSLDWQDEVNGLIDRFEQRWVEDPSRRAVWLAMRSTAATRERAAEHNRQLVATLVPIIGSLPRSIDPQEQQEIAEVTVEAAQAVLHLSVASGEPNPGTVRELKRMLRAYVRALVVG